MNLIVKDTVITHCFYIPSSCYLDNEYSNLCLKIAKLKEQGVIMEEDFSQMKSMLIDKGQKLISDALKEIISVYFRKSYVTFLLLFDECRTCYCHFILSDDW